MPIAPLRTLPVQRTPLRELNLNMLLSCPVLALPMQEGIGVNLTDISGFGNDGVITGATWRNLNGFWYLYLDGVNDRVDVPITPYTFTTLTLLAWLNLPGFTGLIRRLMDWGYSGAPFGSHMWLHAGVDNIDMAIRNTGGGPQSGVEAFTADTWTLVGYKWDGANFYTGKNGVWTNQGAFAGIVAPTVNLRWGERLDGTGDTECSLGPSLVTRKAVSDSEFLNFYNRTKHYFGIFDGNILSRLLKQRELAVVR